jgi:transposase-like protein
MSQKRKRHGAEFKAKVALEALKGAKTVNELSSEHGVHPTQISQWKRQLQQGTRELFAGGQAKAAQDQEAQQAKLYEEIGRLKMELDWLKKTAGLG